MVAIWYQIGTMSTHTRDRPATQQVNLRIPEELLALLDHEARTRYLSRNALVCLILTDHLRPHA
jgi:predicted HicB family RNase H-like nuclease